MAGIKVLATGHAAPKQVLTNDDMSKIVDTSDEWIRTRTGICSRHFSKDEKNWEIAYKAATTALERAEKEYGVKKEQIGYLIVATFTPDYAAPSIACILQKELGLDLEVMSFDVNAACSGFLYGLEIARGMLLGSDETRKKEKPYALVIGSEQISSRLDMEDRSTCVLFGDGAGAAVVELNPEQEWFSVMGSEGNMEVLGCTGQTAEKSYIFMDGKAVYKYAVSKMTEIARTILEKSQLSMDDIDYVVCHQANERIMSAVKKHLNVPDEKLFMNIANYGNTSAASIAIALDEMWEQGLIKKGSKVLCVAFGAGITWAGMLLDF